eukprot:scpid110605/ scgid18676/ 
MFNRTLTFETELNANFMSTTCISTGGVEFAAHQSKFAPGIAAYGNPSEASGVNVDQSEPSWCDLATSNHVWRQCLPWMWHTVCYSRALYTHSQAVTGNGLLETQLHSICAAPSSKGVCKCA